jgi:glucokinase
MVHQNKRGSRRRPGSHRKGSLLLAVDIGGTKVEAGLINAQGRIIFSARSPMVAYGSANQGLRAVRETVDQVILHPRAREVRAIGIVVPGWIDQNTGMVLKAANLPCWRNYPLAKKLRDLYGLPTRVENDASAAAIAEAKWGAGRGYRDFFYVSLGTGIGTGIVQNTPGGSRPDSSEGGHMTINFQGPHCPCGKRGCVEMYASGKALARRAKSLIGKPGASRSLLAKLAQENPGGMKAELVGRAAAAGDPLAIKILEEACDHLALWFGNIIDLLEPEAIVIGGGLGRLISSYAPRIRRRLKELAIHPRRGQVHLVRAQFGSQSALLGAAALWLRN